MRYELAENTKLDAALTYHLTDHFSSALRPSGGLGSSVSATDTVRRSFSLRSFDSTDFQFETNLVHEFDWLDASWRVLGGFDVRHTQLDHSGPGFGNIANFDFVNVLNPTNNVPLPGPYDPAISKFDRAEQATDAWGAYVQAEGWFFDERLKLVAGLRYSSFDYTFSDASPFTYTESPKSFDPRFAILYKLTPATSIYGSYSTSFEQSSSFDVANSDPLEGEQFEIGLKQEFCDGLAQATFSIFDLTQKSLLTADPLDPDITRQIGEAKTRGAELEFRGQVMERLTMVASAAYLDNEITIDNNGDQGNRLRNTPEFEASFWLNYRAIEDLSRSLDVFGGIFYEGARFTGSGNTVEMPGYSTVDIGARYTFDYNESRMNIQAGIKNLLDEEYYSGGFGEGIAFRGEPRTAYMQFGIEF